MKSNKLGMLLILSFFTLFIGFIINPTVFKYFFIGSLSLFFIIFGLISIGLKSTADIGITKGASLVRFEWKGKWAIIIGLGWILVGLYIAKFLF